MFYNLNILQIFFFDLLYLSYLSYKYYFTKIKRHEDNYSIDKKNKNEKHPINSLFKSKNKNDIVDFLNLRF